MSGVHRTRPGADSVAPAEEGQAQQIGAGIWMSPGVSNSYAIATNEGRVIINTGLHIEGPVRSRAFEDVCPGPTHTIIVTQGHADHFGGVKWLGDKNTNVVMHENFPIWRDDHYRIPQFRMRNTAFGWSHISSAMASRIQTLDPADWAITFPEVTTTFRDRLEMMIGGRRIVLFSTPGGETTDALVVWLPDDRTVFTGNLFGPLFGHVPNLITLRGDRYRDALQYVASVDAVLTLGAERLVTGHFEPIDGAELIAEELTALRDSTQWVHDRTIEGMEAGADVSTLMRDIQLPDHFDIGEGYGKTSWNVRAIWETYAGWFHHRSTTELFHVPASAIAPDIVAAASPDALVAAAQARLSAGQALEAIHLIEIVLAAQPAHAGARAVGADAHELLLATSTNYWEQKWLRNVADQLREAPKS